MKPHDLPSPLLPEEPVPMPLGELPPASAARAALPALRPLGPLLFELQALALREDSFDAAATAVLSALARHLRATRVSLALRREPRQSARLLASSDGIDNDRRQLPMRALMNAADEAMDRQDLVESPTPPGTPLAPAVAHAALLRGAEVRAVLGMGFDLGEGQRAALVCELRELPQREQRALARDAAFFVGPVLMLKARAEAGHRERLARWLRPFDEKHRRRRWSLPVLVVLPLAAALLGAGSWPGTHHVVAPARVEGHGQRVVPAPMDGFLQTVAVRPGEAVKAGQVLATLDDKDAALQAEKTTAERQQHERQYLDALTREDAAATEIARARLEQARALDELAQSRLALSRLVAPFDGVVISGDLVSLVGAPVKRGQELMVVAPSQTWRVVAEVDEHDIAHVAAGQPARLLVAALSGDSAEFRIARVSPVAQPLEGRNVFEVEGLVAGPAEGLRPGLRGVARIEAGERAALAVWWERASNAVRRWLWTLLA
jgi:RND family efflux transporter MFP subunit